MVPCSSDLMTPHFSLWEYCWYTAIPGLKDCNCSNLGYVNIAKCRKCNANTTQ